MSNSIIKLSNGGRAVSVYIQEIVEPGIEDSLYPQTGVALVDINAGWVTYLIRFNRVTGTWDTFSPRFHPSRYRASVDFETRMNEALSAAVA